MFHTSLNITTRDFAYFRFGRFGSFVRFRYSIGSGLTGSAVRYGGSEETKAMETKDMLTLEFLVGIFFLLGASFPNHPFSVEPSLYIRKDLFEVHSNRDLRNLQYSEQSF